MNQEQVLKQLGLRIREIRKAQKLTQDEAAHRAGLARSYFGDIERGSRNVAIINLFKIAKALNVEIETFFLQK